MVRRVPASSATFGFVSRRKNICIYYCLILKRFEADVTKKLFVINLGGVILSGYCTVLWGFLNF